MSIAFFPKASTGEGLIQNGGVNAIVIDSSQNVTIPQNLTVSGALAITGGVSQTNRILPSQQFYRLDSGLAGANVTTAQSALGVGVTLSASTVYAFEANLFLSKTAGATSHTLSIGFGGTATINNISYSIVDTNITASGSLVIWGASAVGLTTGYISTTSSTVISSSIASAAANIGMTIKGTVSINAGGTFIPQYTLSAAPGGAYTTQAGSYMLIYPIGAAGSNTNVGTWS